MVNLHSNICAASAMAYCCISTAWHLRLLYLFTATIDFGPVTYQASLLASRSPSTSIVLCAS